MINCGLTVAWTERCSFEQNVGLRQMQPFTNIVWRWRPRPRLRRDALAQSVYIQSIAIGNPAPPPRCYAGDSPCNAKLAQFAILFLEQAN